MATSRRFDWFELQSPDPAAAAAFYGDLLGWTATTTTGEIALHAGTRAFGAITVLPEQARARGAPSHWLAHVVVPDLDAEVARWSSRGAVALGPTRVDATGGRIAKLRDAQGATFALRSAHAGSTGAPVVVFHQLNTIDRERAWSDYGPAFDWVRDALVEGGGDIGSCQTFRWGEDPEIAGAMIELARQPHVHVAWLHYWPVDDLDAAVAKVRRLGGLALEPAKAPWCHRVVACDDPQGAAFALCERAPKR